MKDIDLEIERQKYNKNNYLCDRSSIILACHIPTYGIGYKNDLIFKIKKDLKYFMNLTKNGIVVMGRCTWDSLPIKPLKNRINIILSNHGYKVIKNEIKNYTNTYVVKNFSDLFILLKTLESDKKIFYIGGSTIYKSVVENDMINRMYITEIKTDDEILIDTTFNYSIYSEYKLVNTSDIYSENNLTYQFVEYEREKI